MQISVETSSGKRISLEANAVVAAAATPAMVGSIPPLRAPLCGRCAVAAVAVCALLVVSAAIAGTPPWRASAPQADPDNGVGIASHKGTSSARRASSEVCSSSRGLLSPRLPVGMADSRVPYRNAPNGRFARMSHIHIPKAGGSALNRAVTLVMGNGRVRSEESCWPSFKNMTLPSDLRVVAFRSPRAHILSMYMECVYSPWGAGRRKDAFPVDIHAEIGFIRWVEHFTRSDWLANGGDWGCYNPFSLQSRALTCTGAQFGASHHLKKRQALQPSVSSAVEALREIDVIVVSELFTESLCMLIYRFKGVLPPTCDCRSPNFGIGHRLPYFPHKVPPHSPKAFDVDESVWRKVDQIAAVDTQLYPVVLDRFWQDIREVENRTGKQLLCADRVATLCSSTTYIEGLWR